MVDKLVTTPHLFYDGSCRLCQREISHLYKSLSRHFVLVDISDPSFVGWNGVTRNAMMQKIHVWDGVEFLVGLDATLYYWDKTHLKLLSQLLSLPLIKPIAGYFYNQWARWRVQKSTACDTCSG